jgi:CheY-like chemotaxis protein
MDEKDLSLVKPLRVIAVDDHDDTLVMLEILLGSLGWHVSTANTGEDALRLLDRIRPDVILSDINMPDMDGLDLIREIRARPSGHIPAIAITGSAADEDVALAMSAGFDRHIAKPITLDSLLDVVRTVVPG